MIHPHNILHGARYHHTVALWWIIHKLKLLELLFHIFTVVTDQHSAVTMQYTGGRRCRTQSRLWPWFMPILYCFPYPYSVKVRSYYTDCNCVVVPIYRLLSAASHRSFTTFQVKINSTFMRHHNAETSQFLCRTVQSGTAMQLRWSMNRP